MHTKSPHKNIRLINSLSVGFLVLSLAAVTVTVSDPVRRQLVTLFAETNVTPPTTSYGTARPSPTPLRSPSPTPRGSLPPIPTPANNGTVTLVSPCYRACAIEDIMLPGQTTGRIGFIYPDGNVAGFYQAPNGLYYPVAESGGGPTQNDINGLAQTINTQRTASFNPDSYLALTQINPTVATATTQQLTAQCQADRPPSTINCTTQQGIYQYLTYQHTHAQRLMNDLNSTRPGVDSTLQIMINLAQLQVYMSRNIISRDTYLQMAQHAANLVNLANAQRITPTPSPRPTTSPRSTANPLASTIGSIGSRTVSPRPTSTGIRATVQPGTLPTVRPTLPGITGSVGSRTVSPRPTSTGVRATVQPGTLPTVRPTLPGITGGVGTRTVSPRPTSTGVRATLSPGNLGTGTLPPTTSGGNIGTRFPNVSATAGARATSAPTPFSFVDFVNNAIREAGRTIGIGPSPTPATRQATTPETRVGLSQNGQTTTTYVNTDSGLITTTTQIVRDPSTGRVTDTNITQTRITQTTFEETAAGLVRNDTVITTDLSTGRVINTETNSTLITTTESRLPGLNPEIIRGTAGPSATNAPSLGQQFVDLVNRLIGNGSPSPVQRTPTPAPTPASGSGNSFIENILRIIGIGLPTPTGTTGVRSDVRFTTPTPTSGLGAILNTPRPTGTATPPSGPRVNIDLLQNSIVGGNSGLRLPADYEPGNLVVLNNTITGARFDLFTPALLVEDAVGPLQQWVTWLNQQGYTPLISNAYRSYETQEAYHSSYGSQAATAGGSCHQTGLCFDVHYLIDNRTGNRFEVCSEPHRPECQINLLAQQRAAELGIAHPYNWDQPHYMVAVAADPTIVPFLVQQQSQITSQPYTADYIDELNQRMQNTLSQSLGTTTNSNSSSPTLSNTNSQTTLIPNARYTTNPAGQEFVYFNQFDYRGQPINGTDLTWANRGCGIMVGGMVTNQKPEDFYQDFQSAGYALRVPNNPNNVGSVGMSTSDLINYLQDTGYQVFPVSKDEVNNYTNAGNPVIADTTMQVQGTWTDHLAVVIGVNEAGNYIVNDPAGSPERVITDHDIDRYGTSLTLYVVIPPEQ